jgi:hypothetical protein
MGIRRYSTAAGVVGAALTALTATSALAGGRCGGALGIDAATTLTEVARRCNVNLSALYEANPGVDPRNVTPGTYLAIPDEIDDYAQSGAPATLETVASTEDETNYAQLTDDHGLAGDYDNRISGSYNARVSTRARVRDLQRASADPVWLREATGGGARSYAADRLSFQQRSAARIHSAGVPTFAAPRNSTALSTKAASTQLISCSVLRREEQGELKKVRKIISTPTNTFVEVEPITGGGFDCTLISAADSVPLTPGVPAAHYNLPPRTATVRQAPKLSSSYRVPNYNDINPRAVPAPTKISVSGDVVGEQNGCLVLEGDKGGRWALAAAPGAKSLVGKHVTAWGVAGASDGGCGAGPTLIVSHAVYAEPWGGR